MLLKSRGVNDLLRKHQTGNNSGALLLTIGAFTILAAPCAATLCSSLWLGLAPCFERLEERGLRSGVRLAAFPFVAPQRREPCLGPSKVPADRGLRRPGQAKREPGPQKGWRFDVKDPG
jgi:hypothetical protein